MLKLQAASAKIRVTKTITNNLTDHAPTTLRGVSGQNANCRDYVFRGGGFKNVYELSNRRALKISELYKNHIFQSMGKIFCVEFQRVPMKFHKKYLTPTLRDVDFIHRWKFKSS